MAEHLPAGPAELGAPMDYAAHERTYEGFLDFAKVGLVSVINTLVSLVLYSFGHTGAFLLGTLVLVLTLIAAGIDIGTKSLKASLAVLVIGLVLFVLTVA
jgi:hypothetical protein